MEPSFLLLTMLLRMGCPGIGWGLPGQISFAMAVLQPVQQIVEVRVVLGLGQAGDLVE